MNRLISAIILLTFSVGIGVSGYLYVSNSADDLIEAIKEDRRLTFESGASSAERAKEILRLWDEKGTLLVAILPHSELDEIEMNIKNLDNFQKQGLTEEYLKALNDCESRLEHVTESEKPDFKNIF